MLTQNNAILFIYLLSIVFQILLSVVTVVDGTFKSFFFPSYIHDSFDILISRYILQFLGSIILKDYSVVQGQQKL